MYRPIFTNPLLTSLILFCSFSFCSFSSFISFSQFLKHFRDIYHPCTVQSWQAARSYPHLQWSTVLGIKLSTQEEHGSWTDCTVFYAARYLYLVHKRSLYTSPSPAPSNPQHVTQVDLPSCRENWIPVNPQIKLSVMWFLYHPHSALLQKPCQSHQTLPSTCWWCNTSSAAEWEWSGLWD